MKKRKYYIRPYFYRTDKPHIYFRITDKKPFINRLFSTAHGELTLQQEKDLELTKTFINKLRAKQNGFS